MDYLTNNFPGRAGTIGGEPVVFTKHEKPVKLNPAKKIVESRTKQKVNSLIEASLPNVALSEAAIIEAQMVAEAKEEVLQSGSFVTASKIAKLAGYSSKNPSARPHKWKKDGVIFVIHHKGTDYYPLYTLNPDDNYRPYTALA